MTDSTGRGACQRFALGGMLASLSAGRGGWCSSEGLGGDLVAWGEAAHGVVRAGEGGQRGGVEDGVTARPRRPAATARRRGRRGCDSATAQGQLALSALAGG